MVGGLSPAPAAPLASGAAPRPPLLAPDPPPPATTGTPAPSPAGPPRPRPRAPPAARPRHPRAAPRPPGSRRTARGPTPTGVRQPRRRTAATKGGGGGPSEGRPASKRISV